MIPVHCSQVQQLIQVRSERAARITLSFRSIISDQTFGF
jgi:hypothetical protein